MRADLLALTADDLATLTNRGTVKRAARVRLAAAIYQLGKQPVVKRHGAGVEQVRERLDQRRENGSGSRFRGRFIFRYGHLGQGFYTFARVVARFARAGEELRGEAVSFAFIRRAVFDIYTGVHRWLIIPS